jgi:hypothetical protein
MAGAVDQATSAVTGGLSTVWGFVKSAAPVVLVVGGIGWLFIPAGVPATAGAIIEGVKTAASTATGAATSAFSGVTAGATTTTTLAANSVVAPVTAAASTTSIAAPVVAAPAAASGPVPLFQGT